MKKAIIICGPTASGKTAFAHKFAKKHNGEIINADSMQIYAGLPIITASPEDELRSDLPYHLYNFQDVQNEMSAGQYAYLAASKVKDVSARGRVPIIVGGSGMYIKMLSYGYSAIPEISPEVRALARQKYEDLGSELFYADLKTKDREVVKNFKVQDKQRLMRAYEVYMQTGKSILEFQSQQSIKPLPEFEFDVIFLNPEREFLYNTCNSRFKKLLENGAIEEVESVYKQYGDIKVTAMKALGVAEIISYFKGEINKQELIELASAKTRQYAKRQITWFKNQIANKKTLNYSSVAEYKKITSEVINNESI